MMRPAGVVVTSSRKASLSVNVDWIQARRGDVASRSRSELWRMCGSVAIGAFDKMGVESDKRG
jgi:hypothetical protein